CFLRDHGAVAGIQLGHAGRKASTKRPWEGEGAVPPEEGGWEVVAPSAVPVWDTYPEPPELTAEGIRGIVAAFRAAAARAFEAGFQAAEPHAAHDSLPHPVLSRPSNRRTDRYGGDFENRIRLTLEVVDAVREVWPERLPLFVRISATDWVEGGWTPEESVELARRLKDHGVDLIDCSSGGLVPGARIPVAPGYQVPFAERIRKEAGIMTAAVGLITEPEQADRIVREGQADLALLARQLLRQPHRPLLAPPRLGVDVPWPPQYARARPMQVA